MASLTDADKASFISQIITELEGNKAILVAGQPAAPGSGWDPAMRITALESGEATVKTDDILVAQLEVALKTAVDARRADLERNYDLASASVSSAEGALGKDHPFVASLHKIRGGMSQAPAKPTEPPRP